MTKDRAQGGRERVVVIHPGALGDLIQALPAFERLRAGLPDVHLVHVVGTPLDRISREWKLFDEVIAFDAKTAYHGSPAARLRLIGGLVRRLRRMRPSRVLVFKAARSYALLARLTGAPVRIGLTRGAGARFFTTPVMLDPAWHREDRWHKPVDALGLAAHAPRLADWSVPASDPPLPAFPRGATLISLAPGGGRNAKELSPLRRWPVERYAALATAILARVPNAHFALLGAGDDRLEFDHIMAALPPSSVTSLLDRSIFQTREVIARSDACVVNDSALFHLAGNTTTAPVIVPFGPTDPRISCARRAMMIPIWHPAHAEACHDEAHGTYRACVTPCCIERVSVGEVLDMLLGILNGDRAAAGGARAQEPRAEGQHEPPRESAACR